MNPISQPESAPPRPEVAEPERPATDPPQTPAAPARTPLRMSGELAGRLLSSSRWLQ